jgi:hypothetical protein
VRQSLEAVVSAKAGIALVKARPAHAALVDHKNSRLFISLTSIRCYELVVDGLEIITAQARCEYRKLEQSAQAATHSAGKVYTVFGKSLKSVSTRWTGVVEWRSSEY